MISHPDHRRGEFESKMTQTQPRCGRHSSSGFSKWVTSILDLFATLSVCQSRLWLRGCPKEDARRSHASTALMLSVCTRHTPEHIDRKTYHKHFNSSITKKEKEQLEFGFSFCVSGNLFDEKLKFKWDGKRRILICHLSECFGAT